MKPLLILSALPGAGLAQGPASAPRGETGRGPGGPAAPMAAANFRAPKVSSILTDQQVQQMRQADVEARKQAV